MPMTIIGTSLRPIARAMAEDVRRIGVLWSGDHLFEGTVEVLEILRNKGKYPPPNKRACPNHSSRQASSLRHEQQHKIPRRIHEETHRHGNPRQSRTSTPLPPPGLQLKNEYSGRRLRLLLQRRSLHLAHPPPSRLPQNRLRPRRKRNRNRTRQRKRPPHRRHRSLSPTHHRTERLRRNRLRRITGPFRRRRTLWFRFPYQLFENRARISLPTAGRCVPRYEYGYDATFC